MHKRSGKSSFGASSLSSLLLIATSAHLLVGVVTHTRWLLGGNETLFRYYFGYEDPLFLVACTILECTLAYAARKQFSPGQLLHRAWSLIAIAAILHVVGMTLSHILCTDSYLNPLVACHVSWYKNARAILTPLSFFIGGPLHMAVLFGGLVLALRLYRKHGIQKTLKGPDWIILGAVIAYTLHVAYVLIRTRFGVTRPFYPLEFLTWANDPLLCVLLLQAIFLRRSVVQLGQGYVAKCWGAYVVAIFLTSLGSMITWATNYSVLPYPESAFGWYMWPLVYAAYALAPIYQVEAAQAAQVRLRELTLDPWTGAA
jgi:hypothetical protein